MSPFSSYLHQLRLRHGLRQADLAELVGYEQSYISGLEIGCKGPPTREFLDRLVERFELSTQDREDLLAAAEASQRKLVLEPDSSSEMYELFKELREQLHGLHPVQIRLIREALGLRSLLADWQPEPVRRIRRRQKTEATM